MKNLDKVERILEQNKENFVPNFKENYSFKRNRASVGGIKDFKPDPRLFETGSSDFIENAKLRDMKIEKLDLNPVNIYRGNTEFFDIDGIYDSTIRYNQKILNFQKVSSNLKNGTGNVFKDQSFGSLR